MQYAVQNGCQQKTLRYTPSIECLKYAIANDFSWRGVGTREPNQFRVLAMPPNICEEAALQGNIEVMKFAKQRRAPLKDSAIFAAREGHLDCLIFAVENGGENQVIPKDIKTLECFQYLLQRFGLDAVKEKFRWLIPVQTNVQYIQALIDSGISLPGVLVLLRLL
ncbi:hypothetical protein HW132_34435, partial [Brasilonema sp. CT11]|nr:hypothetical protein [Brasilonema sp. CT11]